MAEEEIEFNKTFTKCRRLIKNAFGQLKVRFRVINKGFDLDLDKVTAIIQACCVLHNFLNERNDYILKEWLEDFRNSAQPQQIALYDDTDPTAVAMRKALINYFQIE